MSSGTDCNIEHNPADLFLATAIAMGIILSYIPQHMRIIRLQSSEGISPWYLLLGGLASISNVANVIILQAPYLFCCTFVSTAQCLANLIGLFQILVQWSMFFIIFFLYYQYYPERLKYNNDESDSISHDWRLSLRIRSSLKIYSTILAILIVLIAMIIGLPSGIGKVSAWVLGIFSMILSIFQFLPQIYQTYKHKVLENI